MEALQDVHRTVTRVLQRRTPRRRLLLGVSGLVAIGAIASACGSSASPTSAAAAGGSTAATATALVKTTHNAKLGTILVNSSGLTLYHFTADTATSSACTGSCNSTWPPLMATGSGSPIGGAGVTGLGTLQVSGGRQVTYHGMPLYTYSGDMSAGQTNGQGIEGKWFAVMTTASSATAGVTTTTAPSGATTTTAAGGSYGY
jgi:predicted lipoprotein with Yx(FWY)xxD motif